MHANFMLYVAILVAEPVPLSAKRNFIYVLVLQSFDFQQTAANWLLNVNIKFLFVFIPLV